jgi:hypothetical protein
LRIGFAYFPEVDKLGGEGGLHLELILKLGEETLRREKEIPSKIGEK